MRETPYVLGILVLFLTSCGTGKRSTIGYVAESTGGSTGGTSTFTDSNSDLNSSTSGSTGGSTAGSSNGSLTATNVTINSVAAPCNSNIVASLLMTIPSNGKSVINSDTTFELKVSGCTGIFRVKGFPQKFSQNALLTKRYYALGKYTETLTVESLDATDKVVSSLNVSVAEFQVIDPGNTTTIISGGNTSPLFIPTNVPGFRTIPFSQMVYTCNTPLNSLQGSVNFYNPSSQSVTLEVSGSLVYYIASGIQKTDSSGLSMIIPAGSSQTFIVTNSVATYGCHGSGTFFGKIKIANSMNIVASGTVLTTMPNGLASVFGYEQVQFSISSSGIPSSVPLETTRAVGFGTSAYYCNIYAGYLQAMVTLYNPNDTAISVLVQGSLVHSVSSSASANLPFLFTATVPANSIYSGGIVSTQAGYGCLGIATLNGTVTVQNSSNYIQASGVILTNGYPSTPTSNTTNKPYSIALGLPF